MPETLCTTCGGTILPPAISGAPRGTCHCPRGLLAHAQEEEAAAFVTEYPAVVEAARERMNDIVAADLAPCCTAVTVEYDTNYTHAAVAKARGTVALFCATCRSRIVYRDGAWRKEAP